MKSHRNKILLLILCFLLSFTSVNLGAVLAEENIDIYQLINETGLSVESDDEKGAHLVRIPSETEIQTWASIRKVPEIGDLMYELWFGASIDEAATKSLTTGVDIGKSLIIGSKLPTLDQAQNIVTSLDKGVETTDDFIGAALRNENRELLTMKILTYAFLSSENKFEGHIPLIYWKMLINHEKDNLIQLKDGDDDLILTGGWDSGETILARSQRELFINTEEAVINDFKLDESPSNNKDDIMKLTFDIDRILKKQHPKFFPAYSRVLIDRYAKASKVYEQDVMQYLLKQTLMEKLKNQTVLYANSNKTYLEGKLTPIKNAPIVQNGVPVIPLNGLSEIDNQIKISRTKDQVTITRSNKKIVIKIGSKNATVNGKQVSIQNPIYLVNNIALIPLKTYSQIIGVEMFYDRGVIALGVNKPYTLPADKGFIDLLVNELKPLSNFNAYLDYAKNSTPINTKLKIISTIDKFGKVPVTDTLNIVEEAGIVSSYSKIFVNGLWQEKSKQGNRDWSFLRSNDYGNLDYLDMYTGYEPARNYEIYKDNKLILEFESKVARQYFNNFFLVQTSKGLGFIDRTAHQLVLVNNTDRPITINDKHSLLDYEELSKYHEYLFFDIDRSKLFYPALSGSKHILGYKQLNYSTGIPLWDGAVQAVYKINGSLPEVTTKYQDLFHYVAQGNLLLAEVRLDVVNLTLMDTNFKVLKKSTIPLKKELNSIVSITTTQDEIHIWQVYEYRKEKFLRQVRVSL